MKTSLLCGALALVLACHGGSSAQTVANGVSTNTAGSATLTTHCNGVTQLMGGGGNCVGLAQTIVDNSIGRNLGTVWGLKGDEWHGTQGIAMEIAPKSAGISEALTLYYNGYKFAGDTSVVRIFDNFHPGGGTDGSGERHKGLYLFESVLADPIGTVNFTAEGTTFLDWTQTNNCGVQGKGGGNCTGGGGILVRTSAPLYKTTVSANKEPGAALYGTMTVARPMTPTLIVPIPNGIPDIQGASDFASGEAVRVIVGAPTLAGNAAPLSAIPASGTACVTGPEEVQPEELNYTLSGSTMTLAHHRYPHGPTAVAFLCGKGTYVESPAETVLHPRVRALAMVLGNVDAHTIAYTSSYNANRSFIHADGVFSPGTAGRDEIIVYDGAYVLGGNGAPSATALEGPMPLETNHVPWTKGDTVEEGVQPAQEHVLVHKGCMGGLPATGATNDCEDTDVNDAFIDFVDKITLRVPASLTKPGGGLLPPPIIRVVVGTGDNNGVFGTLDLLGHSPSYAITNVAGCVGGDTTKDCAHSPEYSLWQQFHSKMGMQATRFNPHSGMFRFDLGFPVFQNGLYSRGHGLYFVAPNETAATLPTVIGNIDSEKPGVVDVGNGKPNDTSGQIKTTFFTPTSAPDTACTQALGGTPRYIHHGPGKADSYQICLMGADNAWAWRTPTFTNFP